MFKDDVCYFSSSRKSQLLVNCWIHISLCCSITSFNLVQRFQYILCPFHGGRSVTTVLCHFFWALRIYYSITNCNNSFSRYTPISGKEIMKDGLTFGNKVIKNEKMQSILLLFCLKKFTKLCFPIFHSFYYKYKS